MTHARKLTLARRMRTDEEVRTNVSPFTSLAWKARREARARKVFNQELVAKEKATERRKGAKA